MFNNKFNDNKYNMKNIINQKISFHNKLIIFFVLTFITLILSGYKFASGDLSLHMTYIIKYIDNSLFSATSNNVINISFS